jgi:hypothetical protein
MHVANPHRLCPLRKDTEDRLQHPVVPAVPGPDRRNCLLGDAAIGAIPGARKLDATIQAPVPARPPGVAEGWNGVRLGPLEKCL